MKKIIVSADCHGRFVEIFAKVEQLHAKNNFDLMLMIGDVCTVESAAFVQKLVTQEIILGLPVYFITNSELSIVLEHAYPSGHMLAHNFTFLGRRGITDLQGLKVAYYSGSQADLHTLEEDKAFLSEAESESVDLLLTNEWPKEMQTMAGKDFQTKSSYVSRLSYCASPKYHLAAGGDAFCRLEPFTSRKGHSTHFICVAPFLG